jgi:hypothetical protein
VDKFVDAANTLLGKPCQTSFFPGESRRCEGSPSLSLGVNSGQFPSRDHRSKWYGRLAIHLAELSPSCPQPPVDNSALGGGFIHIRGL